MGLRGPKPRPLHERALTNPRVSLPENVIAMTQPTPSQGGSGDLGWSPTRAELRSVLPKGRTFVRQWVDVHVCSHREGVIVLAAGRALAEADRWHRRSRAKGQ